jgi:hypothetical protein
MPQIEDDLPVRGQVQPVVAQPLGP